MAIASRKSHALQVLRAMRLLSFALGCTTLISSAGCHSWQMEPTFPQRPAGHADDVRVTLRNGKRVVVDGAQVVGDSLVGRQSNGARQHAVALTDIQRVEGRRFNAGATIALSLGIALVVGAGMAAVAFSMGSMSMNLGY